MKSRIYTYTLATKLRRQKAAAHGVGLSGTAMRRSASSLNDLLEGTNETSRIRLSWRPPAELSDWQLTIRDKSYSVHKAIVGAGERRSTTLRDIFDHYNNPQLADGGVGGRPHSDRKSVV